MKKFILGFLLGCILFTAIPISAAVQDYILRKANYSVMIKGKMYSDPDLPILNYKGYTYAPLRSMLSAAGLTINWSDGMAIVTSASAPSQDKLTVTEIAAQNVAVVMIKTYDINHKPLGSGSGFIISADGKVVTNYHVIDYANSVEVITSDNRVFAVDSVLGYDTQRDIAVLKINNINNLPSVKLGDSSKIQLGEEIVVIGSPLGLQNTVSTGIISSIKPNIYRTVTSSDIQITAPISHGSSGGALFNMFGEVIGITYAGIEEGQNLNFAIPINDLSAVPQTMNLTIRQVYEKEHMLLYNNGKYEGELLNGVENGIGIFTWNNGDIYIGSWKNGQRTGFGIYIWASGETYEGYWENGLKDGYGVLYDSNGNTIRAGYWDNDLPINR